MLIKTTVTILTLSLFSASLAWANSNPRSASNKISYRASQTSRTQFSENKNRVMVDAAPMLIGGAGVAYERSLLTKFTVGALFSSYKFNAENEGLKESSYEGTNLGVLGRYFFEKRPDTSTPYLMGGVVATRVTAKAAFSGTQAGEGSANSVGPLAGVGYQFMNKNLIQGSSVFVDLGLTYGNGYKVTYKARSANGGQTQIQDLQASSGFYAEAQFGLTF